MDLLNVSTFEYRHYLSKAGEGESHRLVGNELRKEDSHKDLPFWEDQFFSEN